MKIDKKGSTNMDVIVGIVGIVIVACLVVGLSCMVSSDEYDDDNFLHNGLGVLDDDEALNLWKMSQL
jgi:hypothetical protein